jgi:hypothetical protein
VFVANGGEDADFARFRNATGGAYEAMYQAIKAWGPYQLVDAPAKADLVFSVSAIATTEGRGGLVLDDLGLRPDPDPNPYPVLRLEVLAGGSAIWRTEAVSKLSFLNKNQEKDFANAVRKMLAPLQYPKSSKPAREEVPLPIEVRLARTVFYTDVDGTVEDTFRKLLTASALYTIVDSPDKADLLVETRGYAPLVGTYYGKWAGDNNAIPQVVVLLRDPATSITLWTVAERVYNFGKTTKEEQLNMAVKNVVERLEQTVRPKQKP